jgi:ketosteroid isomerase-like protein
MRSLCGVAVLSLLLTVLLSGCVGAPKLETAPDTAAIAATIDSLTRALDAAIAARDTAAIAGFYAEDAVVLPANAPRVDGKAAVHGLWARFLGMPGFRMPLVPAQQIVSPAGDMVVGLGTWEFDARGPQGQPLHDVGKSVAVYTQVGGQWKIQVDIWNSDQPAAGQAKQ